MGEEPSETNSYWTLQGSGESEVVIERSRFIGFAVPIENEAGAQDYVDEVRRRYHDARHVCFALRAGRGPGQIERSSDDGEPSRSAGMPMLQVLEGRELCDAMVVVVRYFGGVKLGVGGLARAYREAARLALDAAGSVEIFPEVIRELVIPYSVQAQVEHVFEGQQGVRVEDVEYGAEVVMRLALRCSDVDEIQIRLAALLQRDPDDVFVKGAVRADPRS